jgi:hypothetical protein
MTAPRSQPSSDSTSTTSPADHAPPARPPALLPNAEASTCRRVSDRHRVYLVSVDFGME